MWVVYTRHHVEEIAFFLDPFQEPHKVASYLLVVDCDPSSVISEPRPEGANLMISQKETHFLDAPDVAPVKEFISTAFAEVERGRGLSFQYTHILQQLTQRDDPEMLWRIYICLADFVVQIAQRPDVHKELLKNLFSFDWNGADKVIVSFTHLLGLLVSANPNFLPPVAQLIVRNLTVDASSLPSRHARLHDALKNIMSLSPGGQTGLFTTLAEMFPYKLQPLEVQVLYVQELLFMCHYLPHFQQRILDLVITKCLEIDVDIQVEDSVLAAVAAPVGRQRSHESMFAFDDDTGVESGGVALCSSGCGGLSEESSRCIIPGAVEQANKLDGMLSVLFRFVAAQFDHSDGSVRERVFLQLLGIFERRILIIQRSKFVQFILFFMCAKNQAYAESFCRRLLEIFLQVKNAADQRRGAVMYLSSFYCRSLSCPTVLIRDGVLELIRWTVTYCNNNEKDMIVDIERELKEGSDKLFQVDRGGVPCLKHETLYTTVQAICYTLCFYRDDLLEHFLSIDADLVDKMFNLIITFHPLRFAHPIIRSEFSDLLVRMAGIITALGVRVPMLDDDLIALGRDSVTPDHMELIEHIEVLGNKPMESITGLVTDAPFDYMFPFDPCLLRGVGAFVEDGYLTRYDRCGNDDTLRKFSNINSSVATSSRIHANSEDDKSSATSLMQWPSVTHDEDKSSEAVSSYESSLLPSLGLGVQDTRPLSGNKGSIAGEDVQPTITGLTMPPRHPMSANTLRNDGLPPEVESAEEWTPAPLSRQRRRNRRKVAGSPDSSSDAFNAVPSGNSFIAPQGFFRQGLADELHTCTGNPSGIVPSMGNVVFSGLNRGLYARGNGTVPSFDHFAVSVPPRDGLGSATPFAGGGGDVHKGTKHSPALNDFQKRAREYSVGSVGSW